MNYYFKALKKYAVFSGRASRKEYWYFTLFNYLILIGLFIVADYVKGFDMFPLLVGYYLAIIIPHYAVGVRRLHDADFSGWWILLAFVPYGVLVLIMFFMVGSDLGANRYGANPATEH